MPNLVEFDVVSGKYSKSSWTPPYIAPSTQDFESAIQSMIDETAKEKSFKDGVSLASYVNSTVPEWSEQASSFIKWRDETWQYVYSQMKLYESSGNPIPSIEELLSKIERIKWKE